MRMSRKKNCLNATVNEQNWEEIKQFNYVGSIIRNHSRCTNGITFPSQQTKAAIIKIVFGKKKN